MILTIGGTLFTTLTNRLLLLLAAEREQRDSAARMAGAERVEAAERRFELHAATLSAQMIQLSNAVQRLATAPPRAARPIPLDSSPTAWARP